MANLETKPTGSGKEIALLVGVLVLVAAATLGTYYVRTQGAEAFGKTAAATTPTETRGRVTAPPPTTAKPKTRKQTIPVTVVPTNVYQVETIRGSKRDETKFDPDKQK